MNEKENQLARVQRYLDGTATPEEARALEAALLGDPALRREFLRHAHLDAALAGNRRPTFPAVVAESAGGKTLPMAPRRFAWFQGHPLASAAAGLLLGLFSASMIWAYAVTQRQVTLLAEGFEAPPEILRQNFPATTGQWSVVGGHVVGAENGVAPKEGRRMLRLDSKAREKSTRAFYVVDLRAFPQLAPGTKQQFDFRAAFHPAIPGQSDRYLLRAAAFADDLGNVDLRWMRELWGEVQDHSLASAARNLSVSPGTNEWKTLSLTIDVPPGARILVLSVWTATMEENPEERGAHYVDDIRVSAITHEPLP
jgi:hypothetical protein